jgi:hypothetical protein
MPSSPGHRKLGLNLVVQRGDIGGEHVDVGRHPSLMP